MATVYQGVTPASPNVVSVAAPAEGNDFYGRTIPSGYGTRRVDGANIWVSPISTVRVGTTTRQVADFAVSFGTRSGDPGIKTNIVKLWLNDQLIIDKLANPPLRAKGFTYSIYDGGENQGFNPTIEKWQGKGNTPAYRSLIYILVRALPFDVFGVKSVPKISAELSDYAVEAMYALDYTPMSAPPFPELERARPLPPDTGQAYVDWNNNRVVVPDGLNAGGAIRNKVRTFEYSTLNELSQAAVFDRNAFGKGQKYLGKPAQLSNLQVNSGPPSYTGAPFDTTNTGSTGRTFFLPETGYMLIPDNTVIANAVRFVVIDPLTGQVLGKTGVMNAVQSFDAIEHVRMSPVYAIGGGRAIGNT